MIYFENQDFPSSLEGKGETWSFESSSVRKVLRQYLSKELTASTTKCLWCNTSRIGRPGNLKQLRHIRYVSSRFLRGTKSSKLNGFWWNPRLSYVQPPTTTSCSYFVGTTQRPGSNQVHHDLGWSWYLESMAYPSLPSITNRYRI